MKNLPIWLQYLNLAVAVLCISGLVAAGLLWQRLTSLLKQLIRLNLQIIPLLKDMPKTMKILARLEQAAEAGRLANDLLAVGVDQMQEHASGVALDLKDRTDAAKTHSGLPGEAADAAAQQLTIKETVELKLEPKTPDES